jgi:hypothetical protein
VIAGLFPLVNSEGVPLDVLLAGLARLRLTPDWIDFFRDALRHGWRPESTINRIELALQDIHEAASAALVASRLRALHTHLSRELTPREE